MGRLSREPPWKRHIMCHVAPPKCSETHLCAQDKFRIWHQDATLHWKESGNVWMVLDGSNQDSVTCSFMMEISQAGVIQLESRRKQVRHRDQNTFVFINFILKFMHAERAVRFSSLLSWLSCKHPCKLSNGTQGTFIVILICLTQEVEIELKLCACAGRIIPKILGFLGKF